MNNETETVCAIVLLLCSLSSAREIELGLVGRCMGSGEPDGELGEQGSLCFKLPEMLSILQIEILNF